MTPREAIGDFDRVPVVLVFVLDDNLELVPDAFGGCNDDDAFPGLCKAIRCKEC